MKNNNSSRQIIIKDNSIVICLILTVVLIAAGLILAKIAVIGEAGSLYADSIPPQLFRFKIDTRLEQKQEVVSAAAEIKPEVQTPAALPPPAPPAQDTVKAAQPTPVVPQEKTSAAVLPKAGDQP